MMKQLFTVLLFFGLYPVWGQNDSTVQEALPPNSSFLPQNLGPNINTEYDEINPVISPDGKKLYFTRVNHPDNTFGKQDSEDIWYSDLQDDGTWSDAQRLPYLNIGRYNALQYISPDGTVILLNGVMNWKSTFYKFRGVSRSRKTTEGWSAPEMVLVKGLSRQNRGMKSSATLNDEGIVLILSFSRIYNSNRSDLYFSFVKRNGLTWTRPKKIKDLSTKFSEDAPFLMKDDHTLYFASDRLHKGHYDIYKSVREGDGWANWSEPVLMNDTINSSGWESDFKVVRKGNYAYYASTNNSLGRSDIFRVKLYEENPYVVISGKVINSKTGRPMDPGLFTIMANDKPVDSVIFDRRYQTYKFKLPLGQTYTLHADREYYTPKNETVDVAAIREYTEVNQDLKVEPMPFVLVKGRLLEQNTPNLIPASAQPNVYIDNVLSNEVKIDRATGTYSVQLKHGKAYNLQVRATKYEPVPSSLDLSGVSEYKEITLDLFGSREKMAIVSGKIIDKKTGKPFPPRTKLNIKVEGMQAIIATVDSMSSSYQLKLPLGGMYVISANVPNYYPLFENIDLIREQTDVRIYKDLYIVPIEIGQSIRLNNIFFETAKAILKPESYPELNRVVEFLKNSPDIKVEIAGHTDNVGKADYNIRLSNARAKSVADYIVGHGIARDRISSRGYGMTKPVASNKTKQGKALNRRVEFTILDK